MESNKKNFAGIEINAFDVEHLNEIVKELANSNKKSIIANHNLHSLYLFHKDIKMKEFYSLADYVHIDGMPIVLLGNMFKQNLSKANRVTYVDWVYPLMELADKESWRVYFLGSRPGVGEKVKEIFEEQYSNIHFKHHHGYFDMENSEINQFILNEINEFKPQILFLGMGMPRQEKWISEHFNDLNVNAILQSGACMDYVSGEINTPPRWMGKFGVEWLFRLVGEPKRLWKRYLIEPIFLIPIIAKELYKR